MEPPDVPPHHKSAVVVELVQAIDELDPAPDRNSWRRASGRSRSRSGCRSTAQCPHELCGGGEDGPRGCPDANEVTCQQCEATSEVEDTAAPRECPQCGGRQFAVNRCARCPVNEMEFDCAHFAVPWDEATAEEVGGLQVLQDARERCQREEHRQNQPHAFPS